MAGKDPGGSGESHTARRGQGTETGTRPVQGMQSVAHGAGHGGHDGRVCRGVNGTSADCR